MNVSFLKVIENDRVILSVYERGVGLTQACGSAACAAAVMLRFQHLGEGRIQVVQPGGTLITHYDPDESVFYMEGPAQYVYSGCIDM